MEQIKLGKRIMIIGSCGAGKSTLAIQLYEIINIPIIHLDKEYWKPGWVEPNKDEWHEKQSKLVDGESWIIDGNYGGSFDIRFSKADTIIFLDYNRYICLFRLFERWLQYRGKNRIDMGEGCNEKIPELSFIKFVLEFPKKSRPKIIDKMNEYKKIEKIILKNPKETKKFLIEINNCIKNSKNCV